MTLIETLIIAIVEGLTEFLPVSSTGHMIIAQGLMHMESTAFLKAFTVIIQFGAILSVLCVYWRRFFAPVTAAGESWWSATWRFYLKLIVAMIPAVVVGLTLKDFIDSKLESVEMVAWMLVLGGVFMLFSDRLLDGRTSEQTPLTFGRAFVIGMYQCLAALLPGTSRSMVTIVGGMQQRLTRRAAAEFSFFLAVPTMFGAAAKDVYDLAKSGEGNILLEGDHLFLLLVGCGVAFVVALLAIKLFINFVSRYGFRAFGCYRIVVGVLLLLLPHFGIKVALEPSAEPLPSTPSAASTSDSQPRP